MQQGHPRRKQLDRAKHEMKMHNLRKTAAMVAKAVTGLVEMISAFGEGLKAAGKRFAEAFGGR